MIHHVAGPDRRRRGTAAALVVLLASGCVPTNYENGLAPQLSVDAPAGVGDEGFWGADFMVDWQAFGLDLNVCARSPDSTVVTLAPVLRLGWLLTGLPQDSEKDYWWLVLKLGYGTYVWNDAADPVGACSTARAGFGCHLNEFNTIGLEYGTMRLYSTHGSADTVIRGLYLMYSVEF